MCIAKQIDVIGEVDIDGALNGIFVQQMAAIGIARVPLLFVLPPAVVMLFASGMIAHAAVQTVVFMLLLVEYKISSSGTGSSTNGDGGGEGV